MLPNHNIWRSHNDYSFLYSSFSPDGYETLFLIAIFIQTIFTPRASDLLIKMWLPWEFPFVLLRFTSASVIS